MGLFEDLKALGVDVDGGLKRLGGNEALYKRLLNTFVKSIRGQEIPLDFDTSDYEEIKEVMAGGTRLCYACCMIAGAGSRNWRISKSVISG